MNKLISAKLVLLALILIVVGGCGGGGGGSSSQPSHQISGTVVTADGVGVQGATVTLSGSGSGSTVTDAKGTYTFAGLADGSYTVTITKANYTPKTAIFTVHGADIGTANFSATPCGSIFYVVDDANNLAKLDIAARTVTIIGNTQTFLNDIAFDAAGTLYGISGDQLYRIDPGTAQVTAVGSLGITDVTSLDFGPGGILYTANTSLCKINPQTGAASVIGQGGDIQYMSSGDLAFLGSRLYLTSTFVTGSNALVRLDPATGVATLVGSIGFTNVFGLSSNDGVTLYGFSGTKVLTINPTTGAGTLLWDTNGNGLSAINGAATL